MDADEFIAAARERLADLIAPIDGGAGADISYDPAFEAMKAETEKVNAIDGGKVEWEVVSSNGTNILSEQSKDFRVILYYAAARSKVAGAKGLFDGLVVLAALIETLWEPMYPALKRPRARGNLCPWFGDTAAAAVEAWNPTVAERTSALAFAKVFNTVDGELAEKLGEAFPGLGALTDQVRRLGMRIPAEAPPPPPPAAAPPPKPAPAPSDVTAPPASVRPASQSYEAAPASSSSDGGGGGTGSGYSVADINDDYTARTVLEQVVPLIRRAAEVFRENDPSSSEGIRLARVAAMLFVNDSLGGAGDQVRIGAPDDEIVNNATALFESQDWSQLATLMEGQIADNAMWLDGHYYAAQAYENLGKEGPQRIVESEAMALVKRSPNITELTFFSGTPLASDFTKKWLASLGGSAGGGGGGGGEDPLAKVFERVQEQVTANEIPQAMAQLEKAAKAATTAVVRFRAKLKGAEVALTAGYPDLARAQLDGLERIVQAHRLDEWDPDLVIQLYTLLYRSQTGLGYLQSEYPEQRARVAATWERLCQLDGSVALRALMEQG